MRIMLLQAHEETRDLRTALAEGDQLAARMYQQHSGLQHHASQLAHENRVLAEEAAALRAELAANSSGGVLHHQHHHQHSFSYSRNHHQQQQLQHSQASQASPAVFTPPSQQHLAGVGSAGVSQQAGPARQLQQGSQVAGMAGQGWGRPRANSGISMSSLLSLPGADGVVRVRAAPQAHAQQL